MVDKQEKEDINKAIQLAFGERLKQHKTVHGVDIFIQSLIDSEMRDSIHRGMIAESAPEQLFEIPRWKLAYSLIAVGSMPLPTDVQEKKKIIDSWLGFIVEAVIEKYEELEVEEVRLVGTLKKFSGTQELPST